MTEPITIIFGGLIVSGASVALGKIWGSKGKVNMERCELVHKSLDETLERIEDKIDQRNGNARQKN